MIRNYKDDLPLNTISKIRNILSELDMMTYEVLWGNPYPNVYSVRIESDYTNGEFGTNGKGKDRIYALASAYAEYLERLQNGYLNGVTSLGRVFLNQIKKESGFYFFPDEKFISREEFLNLPSDLMSDLFKDSIPESEVTNYFDRLKQNGYTGVASIPFYDYRNSKTVYLPFNLLNLLTGSNGMAAGNSISEGVYQGLCELLERYASSLVYMNRMTPPTVSEDILKEFIEEYEIISEIKKSGKYEVIVKDFSAGKNIPAIGVIIIDNETNKYKLNIGCDTSFPIALARALTEVYQGYKDANEFDKVLQPIPDKEYDYFFNDDYLSIQKRDYEFKQFTINGLGLFPKALFDKESSYPFDMRVFTPKNTYKQEVKGLIDFFIKDGYNIYMRNVSFLGFPSFYIYIPKISVWGRKSTVKIQSYTSLNEYIDYDRIEDLIFPMTNPNIDKIRKFVDIIEKHTSCIDDYSDTAISIVLKLSFKTTSYWDQLPLSFLMTIYCYLIDDLNNSIKWLSRFIDHTNNHGNDYYNNVLQYLKSKRDGEDISKLAKKEGFFEIINEFEDKDKILNNIDLPNCPQCNECSLYNECLVRTRINTSIRINKAMGKTIISQPNSFESYHFTES